MTNIIERNARIPCKQFKTFKTYSDNQLGVSIQVFEGECEVTIIIFNFSDCWKFKIEVFYLKYEYKNFNSKLDFIHF